MKQNNSVQAKRERTKSIAILGVSIALIVALQALAEGLVKLGFFSLALGMIPVLVVSQLRNWKYGLIVGTFFGLTSLTIATIKGYAGVPVWGHIINPLVSVLPRAVVGLSCSLLAALANHLFDKADAKRQSKCAAMAAAQQEDAPLPTDADTQPATDANMVYATEETTVFATEQSCADAVAKQDNTNENASTPAPKTASARYQKVGRFTRDYLVHAVITVIGVLLNAVGFLGMLLAFASGTAIPESEYSFNLMYIMEFVVGTNTVIELVSFTIVVPAIIQALKRAKVFR